MIKRSFLIFSIFILFFMPLKEAKAKLTKKDYRIMILDIKINKIHIGEDVTYLKKKIFI